MKGFRFYAEFENKTAKNKATVKKLRENPQMGNGNVIAVALDDNNQPLWHRGDDSMDAEVGLLDSPNSPVCSGAVSWHYLREKCIRVPEAVARQIHPAMFEWLDS